MLVPLLSITDEPAEWVTAQRFAHSSPKHLAWAGPSSERHGDGGDPARGRRRKAAAADAA